MCERMENDLTAKNNAQSWRAMLHESGVIFCGYFEVFTAIHMCVRTHVCSLCQYAKNLEKNTQMHLTVLLHGNLKLVWSRSSSFAVSAQQGLDLQYSGITTAPPVHPVFISPTH